MPKTLLIVESPAKARTIGRYLGKDFRIAASVGHIRDLPSATIGVDVKRDFKPTYINMKGKEKVIRELKEMAASSDRILLATDPDREGEAIAWHIASILNLDGQSACRVSFNEITENAVRASVMNPRPLDMHLIDSQQARRILDRLVGYELSPLLWKKIRKGLSAGRVQSVATRVIVEREREIQAFVPEEYWLLTAHLSKRDGKDPVTGESAAAVFRARYHGIGKGGRIERRKLRDKEDAEQVIRETQGQTFSVRDIRKGSKPRHPFAPFTTSTLQQEASRRLGFTSRRTMSVAQQLYEGVDLPGSGATALVTYIRTDSVRVSEDAVAEARKLIASSYGSAYLPQTPHHFKNRSAAQDAHEAIRPSHFDLPPEQVRHALSNEQYRLYKLIWERFLSSQMASAQVDTVTVDVEAGVHVFRAAGETVRFPGFLRLYADIAEEETEPEQNDGKERIPELEKGETLDLAALKPEQKFTQPPPRYTEATLIKAMEEQGIGRPSTYAPTISTILDRKYVDKDKKFLVPTELGMVVTDMLIEHFGDIVDLRFTAEMESRLDTVEEGSRDGISVLREFYEPFHGQIVKAASSMERVQLQTVSTGERCPECGTGDLVIKDGRYGKFIACTRFPECKYTRNIETGVDAKCPLCGSQVLLKTSRKLKSRKFYACDRKGSDPECPFISWDLPIPDSRCETCGSYMVMKSFRGKSYPRCSNRDCATNARKSRDASKSGGDGNPA
ncbi:MAG: type I DNA topoisomerase [Clostridia bacterium]|nr:type I DNA topoisomerase [Clostridia bacterium]